MSELLVYKASAGSGKTFTLAVEYIKLLILNPRATGKFSLSPLPIRQQQK